MRELLGDSTLEPLASGVDDPAHHYDKCECQRLECFHTFLIDVAALPCCCSAVFDIHLTPADPCGRYLEQIVQSRRIGQACVVSLSG